MFILLSANEAGAVRGRSAATPLAALEPIALTDGRFILGDEVLSDPAHAKHFAFLAIRPQADLATITPLLPVSIAPVVTFAATTAPFTPSLGSKVVGAVVAAWKWLVT